MRFLTTLLLLCPGILFGQLSSLHQKSLNAFSIYGSAIGAEYAAVVETAFQHYDVLYGKYPNQYTYICPFQSQDYEVKQVALLSKNLPPAVLAPLKSAYDNLRAAEQKLDQKCKALDTYYKLEDYKRDYYAGAKQLLEEMTPLADAFWKAHRGLQKAIEAAQKSLQGKTPPEVYFSADQRLRKAVEAERAFLDTKKLNFNESKYSGWSAEQLQENIAQSASALAALKKNAPVLKYPESTMWPHFIESYSHYIDLKRHALDEHNFNATQNDQHNNAVYRNLINYFNGTLVADYNTFLKFAAGNGYAGVNAMNYIPAYEINRTAKVVVMEVKPYADVPYDPVVVEKIREPLTRPEFYALNEYVSFINETFNQVRSLHTTLIHFNGRANDFWRISDYSKRAPMQFQFEKFNVPLSYHQKLLTMSKSLPPALHRPLNAQAQVIMNILKEMEALGAALVIEVNERRYEKDKFRRVYEILERQAVLLRHWDDKKEQLYNDVRKIYDAYTPATPTASWQKAGAALRELVDLDHSGLFQAKAYYRGESKAKVPTENIEATLRQVIANEYENMKGIEKLGRYNGRCPYSPYEDVPKNSRTLAEYLSELKAREPGQDRYADPYYDMIYVYNDIVEDYNKFCDLSTMTPHLPAVMQPEMFAVGYPEGHEKDRPADTSPVTEASETEVSVTEEREVPVTETQSPPVEEPKAPGTTSVTAHTRDTIYIERRDTIYIREPNEELRNMDGYATNNMVLLLDVSGSMNQPDKLPLLKESVLRMLDMMRVEDRISIIIFAARPKVLLKSVSFKEEEKIKKAVSDLSSSGKTDGKAAIRLAYKIADESYIRGGNNRIVLATDGEFPMDDDTKELVTGFAGNDIFLSVFNFGKGVGATKILSGLAALGKGNCESITRENVDLKLIREAKARKKK